MILAIVGSTSAMLSDVQPIVEKVIREYLPRAIISGGAKGVDSYAECIGGIHGIPVIVCKPAAKHWPAFKARNVLIAELCDRLVRIASKRSKTYGSGWTRDLAAKLGKPVEEYVVP